MRSRLIIIFIILLFAGIGFVFVIRSTDGNSTVHVSPPDGKTLAQGLARDGWEFIPIDPVHLHPVLNAQNAIDQANNLNPGLQDRPDLTGIGANLGLLYGFFDSNVLKPRLVWIVTYEGIREISSGPIGSKIHSYSNEVDVMLDATTGDYLMSMFWTR